MFLPKDKGGETNSFLETKMEMEKNTDLGIHFFGSRSITFSCFEGCVERKILPDEEKSCNQSCSLGVES